jgi:hypothetical protein
VLRRVGGHRLTIVAMAALGPPIVLLVERAAVALGRERPGWLPAATLVSGGFFLLTWTETTWTWIHPDDALAIAAAAVLVWAIATGRPLVAGAAAGIAAGSKVWAVILLALLAWFPRREAMRAVAVGVAVTALIWAPFVLTAPSTLRNQEGEVRVRADSGLHLLGAHQLLVPGWVRPLQLGAAVALILVAVWRRRVGAALLAAFAFRLAIDPQTWSYYAASAVFGGLVWDLTRRGRPLPVWAPLAYFAFLGVPRLIESADAEGAIRLTAGLAAAAMAFGVTQRRTRGV